MWILTIFLRERAAWLTQTSFSLPITVIEVTEDDISWSHTLRRAYGLLVIDSINLACAVRRGITDIATHDTDFLHVPKLNIWQPTDI